MSTLAIIVLLVRDIFNVANLIIINHANLLYWGRLGDFLDHFNEPAALCSELLNRNSVDNVSGPP